MTAGGSIPATRRSGVACIIDGVWEGWNVVCLIQIGLVDSASCTRKGKTVADCESCVLV